MDIFTKLVHAFCSSENQGAPEARLGKQLQRRDRTPENSKGQKHSTDPFYAPEFIAQWFRQRGAAYHFVFKKNLHVTNIQFAELLTLIRKFVISDDDEDVKDLQFSSVDDFNRSMTEMVGSFQRDPVVPASRYQTVAGLYLPVLRRNLVVTNFFGSCEVFVPPGLTLDLCKLCGYAGYIHSCGRNVYTRNAYKSTKEEFFRSLDAHLGRFPRSGKPLLFRLYAHEDFTKGDRKQADELRHGLDDLKIFVEKFYMGSEPLVSVIKEMRERYKNHIVIPGSGKASEVDARLKHDQNRTLWFIVDHGIAPSLKHASETFYFICYEQEWMNGNPFHLFDENKPAWVNHTTIPHTLMGAMLNITSAWWPRDQVTVGDPFVGTGTTWLEALKYDTVQCDCGDNDIIASLLARDNLEFFAMSQRDLARLARLLKGIETRIPTQSEPRGLGPGQRTSDASYLWAVGVFEKLSPSTTKDSYSFNRELVDELEERTLGDRLFFYLCLRVGLRHRVGLQRGATAWNDAYTKEVRTLRGQIARLLGLRTKPTEIKDAPGLCALTGKYSRVCSVNYGVLRSIFDKKEVPVAFRDALKLPNSKFDVIITDPPYGFNTESDPLELSRLYADLATVLLGALKDEGQLVIALPDWSHTGRQVPFFAHKEIVTLQVFVAAEKLNREVISGAFAAPRPGEIFRPPYYWEAERALRRAILHFRVRALGEELRGR